MYKTISKLSRVMLCVAISTALVQPAMADKPEWAGGGKGGGHGEGHGHGNSGKHGKVSRDDDRPVADIRVSGYFDSHQREVVRSYYGNQGKSGHCPPGLAKKNNGCLPPGQAKKWMMGQPLPSTVAYYPVPSAVVVQLGAPPAGHKYVRVAGDILLIAVGTGMVVDAIQDLGGL
jgi:Ni/Co efflux regulator RcnB